MLKGKWNDILWHIEPLMISYVILITAMASFKRWGAWLKGAGHLLQFLCLGEALWGRSTHLLMLNRNSLLGTRVALSSFLLLFIPSSPSCAFPCPSLAPPTPQPAPSLFLPSLSPSICPSVFFQHHLQEAILPRVMLWLLTAFQWSDNVLLANSQADICLALGTRPRTQCKLFELGNLFCSLINSHNLAQKKFIA